VEPVQDEGNFKLKKQVALIATLTKELDSTMEEVEFRQGKYEEAMKAIQKMKRRYPQEWETLSDEETKEFSPHSPPRKMAMRAPPAYIIPNDVEGHA
jgi:anion-transporting  ArsA/GET3 family ATPase